MADPFFRHLDDFLRHQKSKHGLLLDVGAGAGANSDRAGMAGVNVVALDVDLALTRETARHHLSVRGDAKQLPFQDGSFDSAMAVWVLEHVDDASGVIHEIHRVLKPYGKLFLAVPCRKGLPVMFGTLYVYAAHLVMPKEQRNRHFHIEQNLSYGEVTALLRLSYFTIERVTHSHFALTALLAGNYPWSRPFHRVLSRLAEKLGLNAFLINTAFTCARGAHHDEVSADRLTAEEH